jgi:hypothetical protein
MNINRDFLIVLDVKSGEVDSPNIYYFNTDKNTSNLYVQMVLRETTVEVTPIENAAEYSIKANILKPNMVAKEVEGTLVNPEKAIYEFKLPADCTDFSGNAKIEFEVYTGDKIATSFTTKFKVNGSILTEQNKYIEDSSDYPILKELMAEVVEINKTANELDTTIRTLQADMIEANEEMKTNEVTRQANETTRVANEEARKEAERTRASQEATREGQEATRIANENERKTAENQRKANENVRIANENERKSAEASRVSAENTRVANEEERKANEANRVVAEEIRKANEEARIAEHETFRTEQQAMKTELAEVKAENAILMGNDKKIADRMTQVEISDKRQYVIMEGLMNSAGDGYLKIEDTGNDTTLYNSVEGFVDVKNIVGNTMVNSIKNPDDEFTLNADINTSGQSLTLTTAVDNGQVDVLAEGNTMVNVCDQQEAVAITKSYAVESGNHVALQGEYDGKARPVVTGNTLWIDNDTEELLTEFDDTKNLRLQSSFEDKVVTQEMVDNGKELAENLGKYRVDYKVTGKNKFKQNWVDGKAIGFDNGELYDSANWTSNIEYIRVEPNSQYIFNVKSSVSTFFAVFYDSNKKSLGGKQIWDSFITPNNCKYVRFYVSIGNKELFTQLEEGITRTDYEPYKESIKTYYLNSPLLEGDTIEESNGNVYHVHRYGKVVLDGSDNYDWGAYNLTDDYPNVAGFYFKIPNKDSGYILCDKLPVNNGYILQGRIDRNEEVIGGKDRQYIKFTILRSKLSTLDISGAKQWLSNNPLTVVYQLASPTRELISQSDTILTDSYVNGHLDFDSAVPIEKVQFKENFNTACKYIYASTEYIIQFESDNNGKIDKLHLAGSNSNTDVNVVKGINKFRHTTNSTLGSKSVLITGIGFNASNIVVTEAIEQDFGYFTGMKSVGELEENTIEIVSANGTDSTTEGYLSNSKQILLNEPLRAVGDTKDRFVQIDGKWYVERNCAERNYETDDETNTSYKTDKVKTVYTLPSPTYEPVEIAPTVNTYTDVTHITNNSTIPMNMPVVNSGYELIAKPSTKYTVVGITNGRIGDSTIVNGTITTPATITDNFLRPYGTGTTSKVMLLEGEPANIPGYFKGIKSVFEDKVTEDGKYACKVRVYNDLGEETVQTLYLDEPLYNTNNITIYNDKLGYWKNYDIRDYQDGDFGTYLTDMTKTVYQLAEPVFVPLIDNCPNWVIGSWDNCSIHFDSIIPLLSTRYRYTGNVPSVVTMSEDIDTVSSISDEQDALLIDMATELAVMKLTM